MLEEEAVTDTEFLAVLSSLAVVRKVPVYVTEPPPGAMPPLVSGTLIVRHPSTCGV